MDSGVSIEKLILIRYVCNMAYKAGSTVTEKDLADSNPQIVRKTKEEAGEK